MRLIVGMYDRQISDYQKLQCQMAHKNRAQHVAIIMYGRRHIIHAAVRPYACQSRRQQHLVQMF